MELSTFSPWRAHRAPRHAIRALLFGSLVLYGLLAGRSLNAQDKLQLNFGLYSANKPSTMVTLFRPTLQAIEAGMAQRLQQPVEIRLQIASELDESIASLANGQFDFSRLQPAAYVAARRTNQDILLLAAEQASDVDRLLGIIAVRSDDSIATVEDLKGRSFAFGDEGSTIGRYLSQQFLQQQGLLANDLERYAYLGRNDTVATAVAAGDFDAGAIDEETFRSLVSAGAPLRELARFADISQPWVARSGLPSEIVDALQQTLLSLGDAETLKNLDIKSLIPGADEDYQAMRQAMEDNYLFFLDTAAPAGVPEPPAAAARSPAQPGPEPLAAPIAGVNLPVAPATRAASAATEPLTVTIKLPSALLASARTAAGTGRLTINLDFEQPAVQTGDSGPEDVKVQVHLSGPLLPPIDQSGR